jgi:hypothetical protein
MPKYVFSCALSLGALLLVPASTEAIPIPIGVVAFDTFISGPGGTSAFFVSNLTGDPALGGNALPPDFPVLTSLTFDEANLAWQGPPGSPYQFGSITPGNVDPSPALQFPASSVFTSATFSAVLSSSMFRLADGRMFLAPSANVFAILAGSSSGLLPGDFAVLSVEADEVSVPEPPTMLLLAFVLAGWAVRRTLDSRRRYRSLTPNL